MIILNNAKQKVNKYNCNGQAAERYNLAYNDILVKAGNQCSLVDAKGNVDTISLMIIEKGLKAFDMGEQMDSRFTDKLRRKLNDDSVKLLLKEFRLYSILSKDIESIKGNVQKFFEFLRAKGNDGLSKSHDFCFNVGATKIMNFMFPNLFVISDKWVRKAHNQQEIFGFNDYWRIMLSCRNELSEWQDTYMGLNSLTGWITSQQSLYECLTNALL